MQRHITDKPKTVDDSARLRAFLTVERQQMEGAIWKILHRKPHAARQTTARRFLEIERNASA